MLILKQLKQADVRMLKWHVNLELTRYRAEQEEQQAQSAINVALGFYTQVPVPLQVRLLRCSGSSSKATACATWTKSFRCHPPKRSQQHQRNPPKPHKGNPPNARTRRSNLSQTSLIMSRGLTDSKLDEACKRRGIKWEKSIRQGDESRGDMISRVSKANLTVKRRLGRRLAKPIALGLEEWPSD